MPIRARGGTWQVDVRLPDGRRYRKAVATEAEAIELQATLTTTPQQRRAMKQALRKSPVASEPTAQPSAPPSSAAPEPCRPAKSSRSTLPKSVLTFPGSASTIGT